MKKAILIALLLIGMSALAGCSGGEGSSTAEPTPLAVVNGEPVTLEQLNHRMRFLSLGFANASAGTLKGEAGLEALSQLIQETLYLQEARKKGIAVKPGEINAHMEKLSKEYPEGVLDESIRRNGLSMSDFRAEVARELTIQKLVDAEVYSKLEPDDGKLRKYFEEHKGEFDRQESVRARQIVVDNDADARGILQELKRGADFSEMARKRSLSPDSEQGGDLGYFSRGDMPPEFEEVVFRMKPGEMSGVVHTPYGYHIFLVDDVVKASSPTFEQARQTVRKLYLADAGEDAYAAWQEALLDGASISVHAEGIGRL